LTRCTLEAKAVIDEAKEETDDGTNEVQEITIDGTISEGRLGLCTIVVSGKKVEIRILDTLSPMTLCHQM
jgi:hypothetical protein